VMPTVDSSEIRLGDAGLDVCILHGMLHPNLPGAAHKLEEGQVGVLSGSC
jgi:hypothetical protein